ncbi:hypothetical protein GDO81_004269 [Engystomops pustulosus]|uniref:Uncharacterized protein n=1 Tax=Engystomops pustulosus TaxID=76066 RepID=A0AAV6ZW40_ENGPU|nr:hypothetical protein GDO81_004269 [Engystomops pustulosus]
MIDHFSCKCQREIIAEHPPVCFMISCFRMVDKYMCIHTVEDILPYITWVRILSLHKPLVCICSSTTIKTIFHFRLVEYPK